MIKKLNHKNLLQNTTIFFFSIFLSYLTTFKFHIADSINLMKIAWVYFFISLFLYFSIYRKIEFKYLNFVNKLIFKKLKKYKLVNRLSFGIFSLIVGLISSTLLILTKYLQYIGYKSGGNIHYAFVAETINKSVVPILIIVGFLILVISETVLLIRKNKFSFFKSLILSLNSKIIFYFIWFIVVLFTWISYSFINGIINLASGAPWG